MTSQASQRQSPAVPTFIFRGHVAAIHALHFFAANAFLASADSDGWLVVWRVASMRAAAVWKAHEGGVSEIKDWDGERLVTHGRDHKLRVWQLRDEEMGGMDVRLPVDGAESRRSRQPWLLHSMDVSALNFCAFAMCYEEVQASGKEELHGGFGGVNLDKVNQALLYGQMEGRTSDCSIYLAAPNGLDQGGIDFFHLPSERRLSKLPADKETPTGMVMALSLFYHSTSAQLAVASGYEDGHTMLHFRQPLQHSTDVWIWQKMLVSRPHSQPILSLDLTPSKEFYITSSADAIIAKYETPANTSSAAVDLGAKPCKMINTKHAGQQGLTMRSDGKIFATAGWDARIRVYSTKTMKELAVLKWHKEGCYAVAFAKIDSHVNVVDSSSSSDSNSEPVKAYGCDTDREIAKSALDIIKQERSMKAQTTHWLAAGGKDGKISLWNIY